MNNVESYIRDRHDDAHERLCVQRRRCSPASTKEKTSQSRSQPSPSSALADHLIPRDVAHQDALTTLT
ncbi:hypothetical protein GCM10010402_38510 [Actinomadura luteofluorescens]